MKKQEGMAVYVLLLRGVNVGGAGRLPMADLGALLAGLGCEDVQTYSQSGNAVFRSAREAGELTEAIADGIAAGFGFRPAVLLREAGEVAAVLAANPFAQGAEKPRSVHVYFLTSAAREADLARLRALAAPDEDIQLTDTAFYLFAPSIGRSALAAKLERLLGVPATARNLRTVAALAGMARALGAEEARC